MIIRAEVAHRKESGISADVVKNVWHFDSDTLDIARLNEIAGTLNAFYAVIPPGAGEAVSVSGLLSPELADGLGTLTMYDVADPVPRTPIYGPTTFSMLYGTQIGTFPLPDEIACCLTYQADGESGVHRRSVTGRIFIGPLAGTWLERAATGESRPKADYRFHVTRAADKLLDDQGPGWFWAVYSRKHNRTFQVRRAWMDDAWDIQRRRGIAPQSRINTSHF